MFLEVSQNSQENTCARVSFLIKLQAEACNFIKKETQAQVFSCEFCEISKNTFSTEQLRTTASDSSVFHDVLRVFRNISASPNFSKITLPFSTRLIFLPFSTRLVFV